MSQKQVLENIEAVVQNAIPKIPGKWSNIRCIAIKTPTSMSLPFYNKTPEELVVISKMAGLEESTTTNKLEEVEIKEKKETKRKLAAKSPLVQALKKQKKMETEESLGKKSEKAKKSEKKHKKRSLSTEVEVEETVFVEKKQKKKKKRSVSAEVEEEKKTTVVAEQQAKKTFVASKKFKGSKKGYVFRKGEEGVGYYVDVKPVVDRMAMEALKRSAAQQSRGGGRKKGRKGRR